MEIYQPLLDGYANKLVSARRPDGIEIDLVTLYQRLRMRASTARLVARLTGRHRGLLDLATLLEHSTVCNGAYAGIRPVAMDRIVGSENRYADFDCDLLPLADHTAHRWLRIAQARRDGIVLPPVQLIQVGDAYYIRDGHHRLSVARALGELAIDAEVTCLQIEPRVLHVNEAATARSTSVAGLASIRARASPGVGTSRFPQPFAPYRQREAHL